MPKYDERQSKKQRTEENAVSPEIKQYVTERFTLNPLTKIELMKMKQKFGYGLLGEVTYYRTYSRIKPDGGQEHWYDTVVRVVEGVFSIRKDYYIKHRLPWDEEKWQTFAHGFSIAMFKMHFLPPGRGLFAMGTQMVYDRGSAALYNCAATSTEYMVESVDWMMDMLMHGVGCGFNTNWIGEAYMPDKSHPIEHIIEDSREGWVHSTKLLVNAYVSDKSGKRGQWYKFDYSKIRKKGEPLKTFGGTASGPQPLIDLHNDLEMTLDKYIEKKISKTQCIMDVMNLIGVCVVAGGIRRSAQLSIGDPEDAQFYEMKNYEKHPDRINHGWMSNNSIALYKKEDFEKYIPKIAQNIMNNGEPGVINLYNIQKYGKYGKIGGVDKDVRRDKATLVNPCVTGDTLVKTIDGFKRVDQLINRKDIKVVCNDKEFSFTGFWSTGNKDVYQIVTTTGRQIKATSNHQFLNDKNKFVEVSTLKQGDGLAVIDKGIVYETIETIKYVGVEEVYDCTVDEVHWYNANGFVSHNCSEIPLEPFEVCNLSEVFPTRCDTEEELHNAVRYATFYSSTITLLPTHRAETNKIIARNRRIGVSMSGIADWRELKGAPYVTSQCKLLYKIIRQTNKELADEAGIPESIRVTAIKPSGTISILAGVSSGMHFPTFKYAIRRIRVSEHSQIAPVLIKAGIPYEQDSYSKNTLVFEFPIDLGHSRKATEVSAWEQFALLATLQREYSDNMVSATILFNKETEGGHIRDMLTDYIPVLKSVSMLPHTEDGAYKQMPFQGICKEEYLGRISKLGKINWDMFGNSDGAEEKYCNNDTCTLGT